MFVYSVRAATIKLVGGLCLALAALITVIAFIPTDDSLTSDSVGVSSENVSISYNDVKGKEGVAGFLSKFGWEVEGEPVEVKDITIPAEFDRIMTSYNEIQKQQGLDLKKYRRKNAKRYTMLVKNYNGYDGKVYANVIVYKDRVIAGDICSADSKGFMHGFDVRQ